MSGNKFDDDQDVQSILGVLLYAAKAPEDVPAAMAAIPKLPEASRLYVAQELEKSLFQQITSYEDEDITNMKNAAESLETLASGNSGFTPKSLSAIMNITSFVFENRKGRTSLAVKILHEEFEKIPAAERKQSQKLLRAIVSTAEQCLALRNKNEVFFNDLTMSEKDDSVRQALSALSQQTELDRLFVADLLEFTFSRLENKIEKSVVDKTRVVATDGEEKSTEHPLFKEILDFVLKTRGEAASPFAICCADIFGKFGAAPTLRDYREALCTAYEAAQKWPETQAAKKALQLAEEQKNTSAAAAELAEERRNNLRKLMPNKKTPSLAPSPHKNQPCK